MPKKRGDIVQTRSGTTKLACGAYDAKFGVRCCAERGHEGPHLDAIGQRFERPRAHRTIVRLADFPRFLAAQGGGGPVLSGMVKEELLKWNESLDILSAVLFQMEHGEASDALDIGVFGDGTQDDLRWCRESIKSVIKQLS